MATAMKTDDGRRNVVTAGEVGAWLTYAAAQRYTGLGRTTLWQLLSAGAIEGAKVGRMVRISRRSLDEYMQQNPYVGLRK